jgi:putative hydrolase of the HAD superfamily
VAPGLRARRLPSVDLDWLLFDADGVIQGVRDGWLEQLTAAGGDRGEEFVLAVFAAEMACITGQDFEAAIDQVLRDFKITAGLHEVIDPQYWIEVDPTMIGAVRGLRDLGLRCGLATNQQNLRGTYMRGSLGFDEVFDAQFYSWELGVAKPDPAYFETIIETIKVSPERVLFLDDNEPNVDGARSAGLRAELFPRGGGLDALHPILERHGLIR